MQSVDLVLRANALLLRFLAVGLDLSTKVELVVFLAVLIKLSVRIGLVVFAVRLELPIVYVFLRI